MTDEALIEKMAEAMWKSVDWHKGTPWAEAFDGDRTDYITFARAALSVVRENDKMVQAGSTGADDRLVPMPVLNDVLIYGRGYLMIEPDGTITRLDPKTVNLDGTPLALPREVPAQAETGWVSVGFKKGDIVKHIDGKTYQFDGEALQPSDHRSAPAAHREPDLPSSLLTRLDCPGGLTKG